MTFHHDLPISLFQQSLVGHLPNDENNDAEKYLEKTKEFTKCLVNEQLLLRDSNKPILRISFLPTLACDATQLFFVLLILFVQHIVAI